jgi:hypothetical protein
MIVRIKSQDWQLPPTILFKTLKEPLFWSLRLEGSDGELCRYVPFAIKGTIGTVKDNLLAVFRTMTPLGIQVSECDMPPSAFTALCGYLTRVGNLDRFLFGGIAFQFPQSENSVTIRGDLRGYTFVIVVPWE